MLTVLQAPHLLAGVERTLGWLLTLVQRHAVNWVRADARRGRREDDESLADMLGLE